MTAVPRFPQKQSGENLGWVAKALRDMIAIFNDQTIDSVEQANRVLVMLYDLIRRLTEIQEQLYWSEQLSSR